MIAIGAGGFPRAAESSHVTPEAAFFLLMKLFEQLADALDGCAGYFATNVHCDAD